MGEESATGDSLHQKLRALEATFSARLPLRMKEIESALAQCQADPTSASAIATLHRLLHTLAGSAGTFGFSALGAHAHLLEGQAQKIAAEGAGLERLKTLAAGVRAFFDWVAANPKGGDEARLSNLTDCLKAVGTDRAERLVLVVDEDPVFSGDLAAQLEYLGYKVVAVPDSARVAAAIAQRMPDVVVMGLGFQSGYQAGADEIGRIQAAVGDHIPSVAISKDSSFEARLAAVRAGTSGYFSKPLDVVALAARLDALTERVGVHPYRILLVDDDGIVAEHYATVLRGVGMEVRVVVRPAETLAALAEFRPELVLMDVYMPDCSGIELAKLIRQDNLYLDVPIVFLSTESDFARQLDAIQSGADDFLTKPIAPMHLVSALTSRGDRYRSLRDLIVRDSLTGLLNHSNIKETLARETARAKRSGSPLSLAMIDIDSFKKVNDSYGHPVGDLVIRALSRLLQQRMRRADTVGRYGGEEFAVIMPDTDPAQAKRVLDLVRESFAQIRHHTGIGDFKCTFSAGVTGLAGKVDANEMFATADAALYVAKGNGRNLVEVG